MKKILILGVNGFIGHHLTARILADTPWQVCGMDIDTSRITHLLQHKRFHFRKGDITKNARWIDRQIRDSDVVLPLVAIATPATYVQDPLRVFELDFEANLPIVRACVQHGKRLIFPSTSEVYGMSTDREFDAETSNLVLGPINKPRWIYSCAKQMMDRVIWAYGMQHGLDFTLFRPFNWIGPGQDDIHAANPGGARVVTQFLGRIVRGESLQLVAGGAQRRSFTYVDDGIDALMRIIRNPRGVASGKIYNIGNPKNNLSVRQMATLMLQLARVDRDLKARARNVRLVATSAAQYYGNGYQDVPNRVPRITNTQLDLGWRPRTTMREAFKHIFDANRRYF
jgi:nucleoside-diphosphate-sugar epimerase